MQFKPIAAIGVLSLVVASLLVAGCTTNTNNASSNNTPTSNQKINAINVTATSLSSSSSLTSEYNVTKNATPGNKFVMYAIYCENINAKDRQMGNPNWIKLRDTDGNIYSYDTYGYSMKQQVGGRTLAGSNGEMNTQPGDKYSGLIVFQIPTNATPKSLTYDDSFTYSAYPNRITINL